MTILQKIEWSFFFMRTILFSLLLIICGCKNTDKNVLLGPQPKPIFSCKDFTFPYCAFLDLDSAKECARQSDRPVLIIYAIFAVCDDHKSYWKLMLEEDVQELVRDNFVLAILLVDDRTILKKIDTAQKTFSGKTIETVGEKNSKMEVDKYQNNGNPLYAIMDCRENKLAGPIFYCPVQEKEKFIAFLNEGIKNYQHKHFLDNL